MYKVLLLLLMLTITACGRENPQAGHSPSPTPAWEDGELQQVTVSRSKGFARVNPAVYGTFTGAEELNVFAEAIRTGERMMGVLDIRKPDYDLTFTAEGSEQSYHLWLDPRQDIGLYMDVSDTHTGYNLTEEACKQLKKLIAGIRYSSEQASGNGDVVNLHGKILNLDKWDRFMANVKSGTRDEVQITSYTIEGDPIFSDLIFNGELIEYSYDNTHDAFGSPGKRTTFCNSIEKEETEHGDSFFLGNCHGVEGKQHILVIPK